MTSLSNPAGLRERAAKCRAFAEGRITRLDASEWLRLAEEWDRLADSVEAHAFRAARSANGCDYRQPRPPLPLARMDEARRSQLGTPKCRLTHLSANGAVRRPARPGRVAPLEYSISLRIRQANLSKGHRSSRVLSPPAKGCRPAGSLRGRSKPGRQGALHERKGPRPPVTEAEVTRSNVSACSRSRNSGRGAGAVRNGHSSP